jgi:hypothetical protein
MILYNNNERPVVVYIACNDATWREYYQDSEWKFTRLEHPVQLRGMVNPSVRLHEEDCHYELGEYKWVDILPAMADIGYIHLEYAYVEDKIDGTGKEVNLEKFFKTEG